MNSSNKTPPCKKHPCAPHGFVRSSSHSFDRYVCECEFWSPPKGCLFCEDCEGEGGIGNEYDEVCETCNGTGKVDDTDS